MTRQLDVDRALDEWLAEGPSQLPGHVIDGIVRQLDGTEQRRSTWLPGRQRMNRTIIAIAGLAAAIALTLVGAGLFLGLSSGPPGVGGPPAPTASMTPTATAGPSEPQGVQYISERHGYSILLPDDSWTIIELPGSWPLGDNFNEEGPGVDRVAKKVYEPGPYVLINSQSVPIGTTLEQWVTDYVASGRRWWPECALVGSETGMFGGEVGQINRILCPVDGARATEAVTLHGGRAYVLRVFGIPEDPRPTLDEWLSRFRFTD